jgi:hypothetical protein
MQIHPVVRTTNRFCGPAVLSSILKIDTGEAARQIRAVNGRSKVTGTYDWEIIAVLERNGITAKKIFQAGERKPTLAGWLKASGRIRTAGRVFLIVAGRHWQLVSGRRYVCGITREIVSVRDKRVRRRARVHTVYELKRL